MKIRDQILQDIELKMKSLSNPNLVKNEEISPKPSRFKTIMTNVKTKLFAKKSLTEKSSTEKSPKRPSPRYKLTVHRDTPEETQSEEEKVITPKKLVKIEKNPVKREKIIIKPKKMYETESESAKSDDEVLNRKEFASELKSSARKSVSVTSLNAPISEKSKKESMQNIAQSLDSILEMKKEIIAEINKEKSQEMLKDFSSDESIEERKLTYEIPEMKTDVIQKSVLKNYPSVTSVVKKKVIFDLESENEKSDIQAVDTSEPKKVKTNSFFDFDLKDDDSTSATSSIFDGSKLNLNIDNDILKDKISTKAQINVSSKKERKDSESDFDISDLL